ncbi:unnamed protein product [Brassicogethes aeneus]|uniref:Bromo domain-containing protein n=1 Tax=Brassicogethes aeneus TaxID=1431903 RepID=A0A9P0AV06_BRAAE|nr:unnamed protein product [Brassicogethes aeneus]
MTSIQERLQLKREPIDKWSVREQLCLASAVARSGDQNWMSVSRALKPFGDPNRPGDWFHQKNCAAQYGALLGNVETPKRKKRNLTGAEVGIETPAESILRKLLNERQNELKKLLTEEKAEYQKLQEDMAVLQAGKVSEEQLDKWCREIDEEEAKKEQESNAHAQWLKRREQRKLEIERAWRPPKPATPVNVIQKRKNPDSPEAMEIEGIEEMQSPVIQPQEQGKPALSPLLTSLLKSPSQVQNVQTSILHSAITNVNQKLPSIGNNSTIASLLNSSTGIANVSPGLQQLVSSAIGQEQNVDDQNQPMGNDILDDPNLPSIKIDALANSILVRDGPLPEIKKEEVDDIISEIIDTHDMVTDPEQHLQLDRNGDININLELDDFDDDDSILDPPEIEIPKEAQPKEEVPLPQLPPQPQIQPTPQPQQPPPSVDPFEFQEEDPIIFEPTKTMKQMNEAKQYQQQPAPQPHLVPSELVKIAEEEQPQPKQSKVVDPIADKEIKKETIEEMPKKVEKSGGSVEIVEVVGEDEQCDKQLNKSQIQDIVHSTKIKSEEANVVKEKEEPKEEPANPVESLADNKPEIKEVKHEEMPKETKTDVKQPEMETTKKEELSEIEEKEKTSPHNELVPDLYEDINMEVKIDKTGRAKRDYSRTKKKEEKGFDMLLAIEKAQLEGSDQPEENADKELPEDKKDVKLLKPKVENERSNSPWTEEDDTSGSKAKRRYSTATPVDSIPNSPASSVTFEDDKDYRNWKKSVMLVYNRLATNKYASLFLKPITDDQAPGYSNMVYRPMDLQTIKKNIENGHIRTTLEFKRDIMLMFTNAIMYNKTSDTVYNMAKQMQQESMQPIDILLQATSQVDVPLRRETRTSESGTKRKRTLTEETIKNKKRKED